MTCSLPHSPSSIRSLLGVMLLTGLSLLSSCSRTPDEINNLQQEVWKNPKSVEAYMHLGNAYARAQRYKEATEAYKSALAINPDLDEAVHALGAVSFHEKNYAGAVTYFQKHLEHAPKDSLRLYDLGNAYMQLQQYTKAAEAYNGAIENSELFVEAHYNLAICYIHTGRKAEAEAIYKWLLVKNNYLAVSLQNHLKKENSR